MRNSILSELEYRPEGGGLYFKGVRYLLIRPEALASIQHSLEDEGRQVISSKVLFAAGFTGGQLSGLKYKEAMDLSDREAVEFMCRMGGEIGWGRFRLVGLEPDKMRLVVEVDNSPFATSMEGPAEGGVCHLSRGVLAGLVSGLFGVEVQSNEKMCMAKGDSFCRFEVEGVA